MPTPHVDIATALSDAGLGTLATDLFYGPVRDGAQVPDAALFVLETGGFQPVPDIGGASAADLRERSVQLRVRSAQRDYSGGYATAQSAWGAVHKQQPAGYVSWEAGEPLFVETDESGRHHWSINVLVRTHD